MQLSNRLLLILKKIKECNCVCDIGTDHAYIPIELLKNNICKKAIAADIKKGPLDIALKNSKRNNLESKIELRQGDGLEVLNKNEADVIVIAGMGGSLICEILKIGILVASEAREIILQPMNDIEILREWLYDNGFDIFDEELTKEGNKIYNVMCCKYTNTQLNAKSSNKSIKRRINYVIGERLIINKDPLLHEYIKKSIDRYEKIVNGLKRQSEIQIDRVKENVELIKEIQDLLKKLINERVINVTYYVKDVVDYIEEFAPKRLAMDWDNVGLLIGDREQKVEKIMLCLDVTTKVIDKAIEDRVDLIISHHPIIFQGIKSLSGKNFKEKSLIKLIKNDIGVISAHTNLDATIGGVNEFLAKKVGLNNIKNIKKYKQDKIYKLDIFCPADFEEKLRKAICEQGAGHIGNYSDCTFSINGTGTFRALEGTNPFLGKIGEIETVNEVKIETVVSELNLQKVLNAMNESHPYEEVAYDLFPLSLTGQEYGFTKAGELTESVKIKDYISKIKESLNLGSIRFIGDINKKIKKVAVLSGSFDGDLGNIEKNGIELLITGDVKYHTALDIKEMGLNVIDAGHFNTEFIFLEELSLKLKSKFETIKINVNDVEIDPYIVI